MGIARVGNESNTSLVQSNAEEADNILDELDGNVMVGATNTPRLVQDEHTVNISVTAWKEDEGKGIIISIKSSVFAKSVGYYQVILTSIATHCRL